MPELGTGRPPVKVHAGDCHMLDTHHRALDRDEPQCLHSAGLRACGHCPPRARCSDCAVTDWHRIWS
ncbi:DUF6233 domain-containing protein [Streptomyces griseoloalbus]|uniref:DUF6233 domain-containing protein n=1 Tax=Streptomyces griseoloalbus TaxID=67303 RepID=A0ABV3EFX5_9ACTN